MATLTRDQLDEKTQQAYDEILGYKGRWPDVEATLPHLTRQPAILTDHAFNLKKVLDGKVLSENELAQAFYIAALAEGDDSDRDFFYQRALDAGWSEAEVDAIGGMAASMVTFNTYYKFHDNAGDPGFDRLRPGFKAHLRAESGMDLESVEFTYTVISNIYACRPCTVGHVKGYIEAGGSRKKIDAAILASGLYRTWVLLRRHARVNARR